MIVVADVKWVSACPSRVMIIIVFKLKCYVLYG